MGHDIWIQPFLFQLSRWSQRLMQGTQRVGCILYHFLKLRKVNYPDLNV